MPSWIEIEKAIFEYCKLIFFNTAYMSAQVIT